MQQDLADRRMANPVDTVLGRHHSQNRQPAAVPELPNDQLHQPSKQSHAADHTEQIDAQAEKIITEEQAGLRVGTALQPKNHLREISPAPARHLPCLRRLQEGLRQGLVCGFVGNHEAIQHQHKPYPGHQKPV